MLTYVDSSVALARILLEDRRPPQALWSAALVASRLLEYEIWVALHSRGLGKTHGDKARRVVQGIGLVNLSPSEMRRALYPFPAPLRTLDAIHVASMEYLRGNGERVELASYDRRMTTVAEAMGFPLYDLGN